MWYKIYSFLAKIPSKIYLPGKIEISENDKKILAEKLADDYYIILTGTNNHLSAIFVKILTFLKLGRWPKFTHALMNCDNIIDAKDTKSFKFVEATAVGVHYSTFDEVFKCDCVCLLSPKNISQEEWTTIIDALTIQNGKPYDDLFDLMDDSKVSCVELVLNALKESNYEDNFANLEKMIKRRRNLLPIMFRDCPDFDITFEIS